MASIATIIMPVLDLSVPKVKVKGPDGKMEPKLEPLNLSLVDRRLENDMDVTPPRTPNTPTATSYKKHMLKRYSKFWMSFSDILVWKFGETCHDGCMNACFVMCVR